MIKSVNYNINIDENFEERLAVELDERVEMGTWHCECDGFQCAGPYSGKGFGSY
ncbi:hypothetical protein [Clostridium thermarum]|uniref:hypothetical protein n=1 Tax=Clostridium thermarum TaxID=1716543 RepID=UPI0013D5276A|nr:hypothetical protein [Clostridium thermarum]